VFFFAFSNEFGLLFVLDSFVRIEASFIHIEATTNIMFLANIDYCMSDGGAKILVVDDEPRFVEAHRRWLEDQYTVVVAYDGDEALEKVDETVDVVLLDRRMPTISGLEVLETIRDRGLDCVVIVVSSVKPEIDIVNNQFDDYIVKPTDQETLIELIEEWLDVRGHDQRREYRALESKREMLETQESTRTLADNDIYSNLTDRLNTLQDAISVPEDES
jgi:CheY-like chemotaxis protein